MTDEAGDRQRSFDSGGPTLAEMGEAELVRRLAEIALPTAAALELGPGDDAALWAPEPGLLVALSQDALVEGTDFRRSWTTPRQLGSRAFSVAVSDLAGSGVRPAWCSATLCAPAATCAEDVLEIQRGLCAAAAGAGCAVAGGDVSDIDGPLVIDLAVGGCVARGCDLRRDRGRPGDLLLVTGRLGRAAAGLRLLLGEWIDPVPDAGGGWIEAHVAPVARVAEGVLLAGLGVRCGGDISDGLLVETERLAGASACGAELWLDRVPVEVSLIDVFGQAWPDLALGGGEDFELVVAADAGLAAAVLAEWPETLAPLCSVGRLREGAGVTVLEREGGAPATRPRVSSRHYG